MASGADNFGTGWSYGSSIEETKLILDAYLKVPNWELESTIR